MKRREFIRTSCTICIAMGAGLLSEGLSSCASVPVYRTDVVDHTVTIPASLFVDTDFRIVRPGNLTYDIAVRREKNGSYVAFLLRCTHADNPLNYNGHGYYCSLHGSSYDEEGAVTHGPAVRSLQRLKIRELADEIIVFV